MNLLRRRNDERRLINILTLALLLSVVANVSLFFIHLSDNQLHSFQSFQDEHIIRSLPAKVRPNEKKKKHVSVNHENRTTKRVEEVLEPLQADFVPPNKLSKLSCDHLGGPFEYENDDVFNLQEMVYWHDIPTDKQVLSPYAQRNQHRSGEEKFLIFDIDPAGFNNKRLSFECFIIMAITMGRTLVLPPAGYWWGFSHGGGASDETWDFYRFFDLARIEREYSGLKLMSLEDFLKQEAMTGKFTTNSAAGTPAFPPSNKTNWRGWQQPIKRYLSDVNELEKLTWRVEECILGIPADGENTQDLETIHSRLIEKGVQEAYAWIGRPTRVDGRPIRRMEEMMTDRKKLCLYTKEQQEKRFLYFKIVYDPRDVHLMLEVNVRLLQWFYDFFFFEDWTQDLWAKRFIRDNLRYRDQLQCVAARVVKQLRLRAMSKSGTPEFDTLHIRRKGEFGDQYGNLTSAEDIIKSARKDLKENGTIYIATDEPDMTFFEPFRKHYDIVFINDFRAELKGLNPNFLPIIDQLVATRGKVFFGAWCSTFTGYINRLRGYHSTAKKLPGYENGVVSSYYYNFQKEGKRNKMLSYHPPVGPHWFFREFPIAWRDIDHDV